MQAARNGQIVPRLPTQPILPHRLRLHARAAEAVRTSSHAASTPNHTHTTAPHHPASRSRTRRGAISPAPKYHAASRAGTRLNATTTCTIGCCRRRSSTATTAPMTTCGHAARRETRSRPSFRRPRCAVGAARSRPSSQSSHLPSLLAAPDHACRCIGRPRRTTSRTDDIRRPTIECTNGSSRCTRRDERTGRFEINTRRNGPRFKGPRNSLAVL